MATVTKKKKDSFPAIPMTHPSLHGLLKASAQRGWMCYEELNWALPDELLFPEKIDELLVLLQELNVELIGEDDRMRRGWDQHKVPLQTNLRFKRDTPWKTPEIQAMEAAEEDGTKRSHLQMDDDDELLDEAETQAAIAQALEESSSRRIDDPIRMYLTQMGSISLLTREENRIDSHGLPQTRT